MLLCSSSLLLYLHYCNVPTMLSQTRLGLSVHILIHVCVNSNMMRMRTCVRHGYQLYTVTLSCILNTHTLRSQTPMGIYVSVNN
jgi:hypothetical protein